MENKDCDVDNVFKPLTEEEILDRVDASLQDLKNNQYEDVDVFEKRLRKEFAM